MHILTIGAIENIMKTKKICSALGWFFLFLSSQVFATFIYMYWYFYKNPKEINNFLNISAKSIDDITSSMYSHIFPILILSYIIIFIISFIIIFKNKYKFSEYYKLSHKNINISTGISFIVLGLSLNLILSLLGALFPQKWTSADQSFLFNGKNQILEFTTVCLLGPITEEFIFRNKIYQNLSYINISLAVIAQAVLFGLAHGNLIQFLYTIPLALFFIYVDMKYKSVLPSVLMHIGVNTFAFRCYYDQKWTIIITCILTAACFLSFREIFSFLRKEEKINE